MNSITFSEERNEETCCGYCNDYQPHAVKRMFDHKNGMLYVLQWDGAGNLNQISYVDRFGLFNSTRHLAWTEDNRLYTVADERYYSYYAYDHSGGSCASREQSQACLSYAEMEQRRRSQRRLKLTGENKQQDVCQRLRTPQNKLNEVSNADFMSTYTILDNPTLYPSAYMVLTNKGYTNVTEVESRASSLALLRCSNVTERKHYYAGTDLCASREQSQACLSYAETKQSVRSNHLGSASWITDYRGMAVQHIQYLPYGEPYINQHPYGYSERFTFTGNDPRKGWRIPLNEIKYNEQRDALRLNPQSGGLCGARLTSPQDLLTGYGYLPRQARQAHHGARYMDHELMTMWLSVDPLADKYPSISPYAYCAWNPIMLTKS